MPTIISKKGKIFNPPGRPMSKFEIDNGMIIQFKYQKEEKRDPMPMVFVLNTDVHNTGDRGKTINGINLNYLPVSVVDNLFVRMLGSAPYVLDVNTKVWKLKLKDQREPGGLQISPLYNRVFKFFVKKYDCYRSYHYQKMPGAVRQIQYMFDKYPLNQMHLNPDAYEIRLNRVLAHKAVKDTDKVIEEVYDKDNVKESKKDKKRLKNIKQKEQIKNINKQDEKDVVKKVIDIMHDKRKKL